MGGKFSKSKATVSSNNEAVDVSSNKATVSSNKKAIFSMNINPMNHIAQRTDEEEAKRKERLKVQTIATRERNQNKIDENLAIQQQKQIRDNELSNEEEIFKDREGYSLVIDEQLESKLNKIKRDLKKSKQPVVKGDLRSKLQNDLRNSKQPVEEKSDKKGGKTKRANRKEILGKERCIYKKTGDRKEYVKYKGNLITVKDYKKIIKARNNKKIKY
jgi:hypothetical protein